MEACSKIFIDPIAIHVLIQLPLLHFLIFTSTLTQMVNLPPHSMIKTTTTTAIAYGNYISHRLHYARACSLYSDFTTSPSSEYQILSQVRVCKYSSHRIFQNRYQRLLEKYYASCIKMSKDGIRN